MYLSAISHLTESRRDVLTYETCYTPETRSAGSLDHFTLEVMQCSPVTCTMCSPSFSSVAGLYTNPCNRGPSHVLLSSFPVIGMMNPGILLDIIISKSLSPNCCRGRRPISKIKQPRSVSNICLIFHTPNSASHRSIQLYD